MMPYIMDGLMNIVLPAPGGWSFQNDFMFFVRGSIHSIHG